MPFTATHVAAVVPVAWLCRWRVPLSALAIGSMIPDVAGFYPGFFDYPVTHSFQGIVTHNVPLGVAVFYLFHLLLKQPLVDLLPPPISQRLADWSRREIDVHPLRIAVVAICVAFGAMTHVVWDAFTHGDTWGVALLPPLQAVVTYYNGHAIRAYAIVQHGSSLLFLPPLLIGFLWWVMKQTPTPTPERASMPRTVSWTITAMLLVGAWLYFQSLQEHLSGITWVGALRITVKHFGALSMAILILYCIGMHLFWWYQAIRAAGLEGSAFAEAENAVLELVAIPTEGGFENSCQVEASHTSPEPARIHAAQPAREVLRPRQPAKTPANIRTADPSPSS